MKSDFENEIRKAIDNGTSTEALAKQFTDLLNQITKEQEEKQRKDTALAAYKNKCMEKVRKAIQTDNWTNDLIGAVAVLTHAKDDWTLDDMKEFDEGTSRGVATSAETVHMNPFEALTYGLNKIFEEEKAKDRESKPKIMGKTFEDLEKEFQKLIEKL